MTNSLCGSGIAWNRRLKAGIAAKSGFSDAPLGDTAQNTSLSRIQHSMALSTDTDSITDTRNTPARPNCPPPPLRVLRSADGPIPEANFVSFNVPQMAENRRKNEGSNFEK